MAYLYKVVGENAWAMCRPYGYPPGITYNKECATVFKTIKEARFRTIGFPYNSRVVKA